MRGSRDGLRAMRSCCGGAAGCGSCGRACAILSSPKWHSAATAPLRYSSFIAGVPEGRTSGLEADSLSLPGR